MHHLLIFCTQASALLLILTIVRTLNAEQSPMNHATMLRERNLSRSEVFLESTEELLLLCECLVSTVSELGRGIDPFKVDLLERSSAGVDEHGFADGHDTLLNTWNATLEQQEVVLDLTIAYETAHSIVC